MVVQAEQINLKAAAAILSTESTLVVMLCAPLVLYFFVHSLLLVDFIATRLREREKHTENYYYY